MLVVRHCVLVSPDEAGTFAVHRDLVSVGSGVFFDRDAVRSDGLLQMVQLLRP